MKKLPPALVCALVVRIGAAVAMAIARLVISFEGFPVRFLLVSDAFYVAADVLAVVGFLELAGRSSGRVRTGLVVAAAASALGLADSAFWVYVEYASPHWSWLGTLGEYAWFSFDLLLIAGVTIAASARRPTAAIAGVIVVLVCDPVPPLADRLWHAITSDVLATVLMHGMRLAETVAILVLAIIAAAGEGEPARRPRAVVDGLRVVASALWLRVIAAVGVAGLTLLLMMGHAGEGAVGVLKLAMMAGAVINVISLVMIARGALGALGAGVGELPPWPIAACAAGTLWCLGVAVHQLPYTYRMLYGSHESAFGVEAGAESYVQALSLVVPLVATAAIAVISTGVAGFASRRGLEELRSDAQGKGFGFVALMLGSIAVQQWLLPKADSLGNFAFMTLLAAGASLAATVMMARLCTRAADSVHDEPGLPPAKVI